MSRMNRVAFEQYKSDNIDHNHGNGTPKAFATRTADTAAPSRRTIPSQHQPPTRYTPSSPLRHGILLLASSDLRQSLSLWFSSVLNRWFTTRRLAGVRRTLVKSTRFSTERSAEISPKGHVVTTAPDGCTWSDSVSLSDAEVLKWIVCAAPTPPFRPPASCEFASFFEEMETLLPPAAAIWPALPCTTFCTVMVGISAMALATGAKIRPAMSGATARTTWSKNSLSYMVV